MNLQYTDVIAVFDIGRIWKRFDLFDRNLHPLFTEQKLIEEVEDTEGHPCDNLPYIEKWMQSCIKKVIDGGLYRIRSASVAGSASCLTRLESAMKEMVKSPAGGQLSSRCHGLDSTTASLIPYLKGSDRQFILVSTGKWCTFMNPFDGKPSPDGISGGNAGADADRDPGGNAEGKAGADAGSDSGGVMTVGGKQVKFARFLLGEIHDRNVAMLDDRFGVTGELYKTIKIKHKKIEKIRANRRGRVFFRHGIPDGYADTGADLSHFLTYADAYHQMMYDLVDECLESFRAVIAEGDTTEIIYVTGGFAHNDTFVRILAARIPDKRIYASTLDYATAMGAAMEVYNSAFGPDLPPIYLGLKSIRLSDE